MNTETDADYSGSGREVIEIDLDSQFRSLEIEGFEALDFFGDGSFYLLNSSGVSDVTMKRGI